MPTTSLETHTCINTNCLYLFPSVCRSLVDLVILIDGSRSVGRRNFRKVIDFVKSFVSFFPLSARETRVGVIVFSSRSRVEFGLNRYGSRAQVVRAINRIRFVQQDDELTLIECWFSS